MQDDMLIISSTKSNNTDKVEINENEALLLLNQLEVDDDREINKIEEEVEPTLVEEKVINLAKDSIIKDNGIANKLL